MLEVDRFEIFSLRSSAEIFADILLTFLPTFLLTFYRAPGRFWGSRTKMPFFQDSRRVQKYQKIYGQEIALRNITVFDELYCEEHFGM